MQCVKICNVHAKERDNAKAPGQYEIGLWEKRGKATVARSRCCHLDVRHWWEQSEGKYGQGRTWQSWGNVVQAEI